MDQSMELYLKYLGLEQLSEHWDEYLKEAAGKKMSYQHLLSTIVTNEYNHALEKRRLARLKTAYIPERLVMETFPFQHQPNLKKRQIMEIYDSLKFMTECQTLVFIGPTGCGKTGLATAFLTHAINKEYRGRFTDFKELLRQLYASIADHSEKHVLKRFASIGCLLIDEVGYSCLDKPQAGLFFDLIKMRHRKQCTIITSQLGFEEWGSFINDRHLTAAILDRITENCTIFNMTKCISLRQKKVVYATSKEKTEKQSDHQPGLLP
jgi:DNA replication protein DnaC